jgi:hypothetical protein
VPCLLGPKPDGATALNLVKCGDRIVNLDNVTLVNLRYNADHRGAGDVVCIELLDGEFAKFKDEDADALRRHFASLVAGGTIPDVMAGPPAGGNIATKDAEPKDWRTAVSLGEALRGILGELDELSRASLRLGSELSDVRLRGLYPAIRKARWDIRAAMEAAGFKFGEGDTP